MSHAALFVVLEPDQPPRITTAENALSIPQLALQGPATASARITRLPLGTPRHFRDEYEGGMFIDWRRRNLVLFGGDEIGYQRALQRVFLRLLRPIWRGWRIAWAHRGIVDVLDHARRADSNMSLPRLRQLSQKSAQLKVEQATLPLLLEGPARPCENHHPQPWRDGGDCWISIRNERGAIADYCIDSQGYGPIVLRPDLLTTLQQFQSCSPPAELDVHSGALVDSRWRRLIAWDSAPASQLAAALRKNWIGWEVKLQRSGWRRQMELTGRTPDMRAANRRAARRLHAILNPRRLEGAAIAEALRQYGQRASHGGSDIAPASIAAR